MTSPVDHLESLVSKLNLPLPDGFRPISVMLLIHEAVHQEPKLNKQTVLDRDVAGLKTWLQGQANGKFATAMFTAELLKLDDWLTKDEIWEDLEPVLLAMF